MATKVEQEYENTIQLYLNSGYSIVSQTDNSTILLSDDVAIAKNQARLKSYAVSGFAGAESATEMTMAGGVAAAGVQGNNFQVAIRITKTGQLQVSGYTLEKKKTFKAQTKKFNKSTNLVLMIVMLMFAVPFLMVAVIMFSNNDTVLAIITSLGSLFCFFLSFLFFKQSRKKWLSRKKKSLNYGLLP